MHDHIISADSALTPDGGLAPYWLRLNKGTIVETGMGEPRYRPDLHVEDGVVAPGMVDIHCHGGGAASFTEGPIQGEAVLAAHRKRGTTTMLASLVTAPLEVVLAQAEALRPLVQAGELGGIHLEGPWLSPEHRGAHAGHLLSAPSPRAISKVLEHTAANLIRYVTLAPEREGAVEAVARLKAAGITVGIGHTGATCEQTREALAAGATAATHLFNGMKGMGHRDPGPALALMDDPNTFLELICDGVHVHAEMIRHAWELASRNGGAERIVLVSDAMAAAEAADGEYNLGDLTVRVQDRVARLLPTGSTLGAIAGSTLTLAGAVRNSILDAGVAPERALVSASSSPAAMAGLNDVGRLVSGAHADLVIWDKDWQVRSVMRRGRWLDDVQG